MSIAVKICGIRDDQAYKAAVDYGAAYIGFAFIPRSRRRVELENAAAILSEAPPKVPSVGLFEDPTDDDLKTVLAQVPLDIIQLHGHETPQRVTEVKRQTGLKVMKAIPIATFEDLVQVPSYEPVADILLFDTKLGPQPTGGTGIAFDWSILKGRTFAKPWMLAGGININNLAEAVTTTGAKMVDLSTGVEGPTGEKDPEKIRELLQYATKW